MLWLAGLAASFQCYWMVMTNVVIRNFWDPAYAGKYEGLKACMKQYPGRPLWVVLGTSRVEFGLQPEALAERMADRSAPLIYNFGLGGAGIFRQFIYLRRLLADGVKPAVAGIEVFNADLNEPLLRPADFADSQVHARWNELDEYAAYSNDPAGFLAHWRQSRLDPAYQFGMRMPQQTLRWRLIPLPWTWRMERPPYDKWGWITTEFTAPGNDYQTNFQIAKNGYQKDFTNYQILPKTDQILRRMLELCRGEGIGVFLLKMPEAEDFRALHVGRPDAVLAAYLAEIQEKYHVPLVDASLWVGREGFFDGHHMNRTGGPEFTRRLAGVLTGLKL